MKIIKSYMSKLDTEGSLDYAHLAEMMGDVPGAVVAEVCKRAVSLCRKKGTCENGLVEAAINSMQHHLKLMSDTPEASDKMDVTLVINGKEVGVAPKEGEGVQASN